MRVVRLGGETRRRGILGQNRSTPENAGLGIFVLAAVVASLVRTDPIGLAVSGVLLLSGFALFTPRAMLRGLSPAAVLVRRYRWRRRVRRGLTTFTPGAAARRPAPGTDKDGHPRVGKATTVPQEVPDWLGTVRPVTVRTTTGGTVLVLLHDGVGGGPGYASLALEVESGGGGIQSESAEDLEYAKFGRMKAALARDDSLVRGIQQLERIQPASVAAHETWLAQRVPAGVLDVLVQSYSDLLRKVEVTGEWHRSVLVLRMPFTRAWDSRMAETFDRHDQATRAQLAVIEAQRVATIAKAEGGYRSVTPLSEAGLAVAARSCLDPDYSWTDPRPATIRSAWQAYEAKPRAVVVNGAWHVRTCTIPRSSLPIADVPVTHLRRLIVGIFPAVVRTVSITEELTPSWIAREAAAQALTQDRSRARNVKGATDGSEWDQENASQQRLRDLADGQGNQGVGFSIYITVAGKGAAGLTRACQRMEAAANDLGMPLQWLDYEQDLALVTTLPLCRGLAMSRRRVHFG